MVTQNADAGALAAAAGAMEAPISVQEAQDAAALGAAATNMERPLGIPAAAQAGPMDAHEAAAFAAAGASAIDADADVGLMDASGAAAGTVAGPLDAHEAPAFAAAGASAIDADADVGLMDASGAAAGTVAGPMDAHEAPAFEAGAAAGAASSSYDPANPGGTVVNKATVPSSYDPANPGGLSSTRHRAQQLRRRTRAALLRGQRGQPGRTDGCPRGTRLRVRERQRGATGPGRRAPVNRLRPPTVGRVTRPADGYSAPITSGATISSIGTEPSMNPRRTIVS